MKKLLKLITVAAIALTTGSISNIQTRASASDTKTHVMYRLYNPNSGEHFYTAAYKERNHTIDAGWRFEGAGWQAPENGAPVYRLYNANGGEHHYTTSKKEKNYLISVGWKDEGVGWKSGGDIPVYREYNPNAFANNHNYTTDQKEHQYLVSLGWHDEGIGWYAAQPSGEPIENDNATVSVSADIDLTGSGDGFHSKVVINSANGSLASFGIQYDTDRYGKPGCRFILENIMSHASEPGPVGKRYLYAGSAKEGKTYNIRLSWYQDTNELVGYVDGVEIIRDKTTFRVLNGDGQNFAVAVEGVVKHTGDTIDATYDHIKVRSSIDPDTGGLMYGWRDDVPNFHSEKNGLHIQLTDPGRGIVGGPFDTGETDYGYDASMHVYGRGNEGINGHDWDWVAFFADASWTTHAKLPRQVTTPQTRTVTFDPNAADAKVAPKTMKPVVNHYIGRNDDGASRMPVPIRRGYTFTGWYTVSDPAQMNDSNIFTDTTIVSNNITVYAKWEPKTTVKLTFNKNCDDDAVTAPDVMTAAAGQPVGNLPVLSREGYEFDGWKDQDGNEVTSQSIFPDDMVLFAQWKEVSSDSQ